MKRAVCVSYQASSDWALLVVACQEDAYRQIVPMIWASENASPFAEAIQLNLWRHSGQVHVLKNEHLTPQQKESQLADAIAQAVAGVAGQYTILAYEKNPGVLSQVIVKVISKFQSLPNFSISNEPAYRWLVEKSDAAARAHFHLRYLALGDSGSIPALTTLTHEEKAKREEDWLLKGVPPEPPILRPGQRAKNGLVLNPTRRKK